MTKERELFEKTYPAKELANSVYITVEAMGYLKHLRLTNPEQDYWIKPLIAVLALSSIEMVLSM